ncbi:hypothetical protein [Nocardioides lianchengensis]|uniref:hypothetical protein n=1 Tax=Nocardioides lianchengensis TaxID=1045774 RepID=UPI000B83C37B|nr:hypothetical protein [Nocardioides lianchengensis]NYG08772.1 hypothetical protein [Nocardioides lianchengensis]
MELAAKAADRTLAGTMNWKETDDPDLFLYAGSRTSLAIDYYPMDKHYEFRVLNDRGTVVERFSRWPGPDENAPWIEPTPEYLTLQRLHDAARRSALRIDDIIEQAFLDLDHPDDGLPF